MSRIGLLADSHGRAGTTCRAVSLLFDQGVDSLIHLGDVGDTLVIDALLVPASKKGTEPGGAIVPVCLTFGNNDWDWKSMASYARGLGITVGHPWGRVDLPGDRFLVYTHGDDPAILVEAVERGAAYLCHGHTHRAADARTGGTRIINPGALCRAARYSVAVLDTATDGLDFFDVVEPVARA